MTKIVAFSGSARKDSFNTKLVKIAAKGASDAGAEVKLINLANFPMPLFDQDLEKEQGVPEKALEFKNLLIEADGFLIASPEYNSAFSPLLKNVIDWASRATSENEPSLAAFRGKYAAIMSTSPGALGGMRGLVFLRMLLGNLGIIVLPEQKAVSGAIKAFSQDGNLVDDKLQGEILNLGKKLVVLLDKVKG